MSAPEKNSISYSDYYEANLYKFQDGVLNVVKNSGVPFYLTGGTALSRAYYNHRYSDDLDFFVNRDYDFQKHVETVLSLLTNDGFVWSSDVGFVKSVDFCSVIVKRLNQDIGLKLDFVNDIAAHFGNVVSTSLFYRTDSVRNILSNKITAVFRMSPKDVVDIHRICLNESFNWSDVFTEVREKELGVEPCDVAEIIQGIPREAFDSIKWIRPVNFEVFKRDAGQIAKDMLSLAENSMKRV